MASCVESAAFKSNKQPLDTYSLDPLLADSAVGNEYAVVLRNRLRK